MFAFGTFNFLRLIPLISLLFSAQAFAQFEINPDHCDSETDRAARNASAKSKARAAAPRVDATSVQPASMHAPQLNQRIAQQEALLAEYRAQINAKRQQMEAAYQSLLRTGNEAGEAEALMIYQRELDKLQKSLAPAIHATEATLARLRQTPEPRLSPSGP